jgi:anti-sigma B factor antagonist
MSDHGTANRRLTLAVEDYGNAAVVRCNGRLVAGANDSFYHDIRELFPGRPRIVLDLAELTHMDSTGLGTLVRLYVSAKSAGSSLELINVGKPIRQLLGITHVLSVFGNVGESHIRMG